MACDWLLIYVVIATLMAIDLDITAGFNVDTEHVVRHRGAPGSMFGFSVAEHRDRGTSWVLVGAPEAQTTQPGVRRGGAVFRCDVSRDDSCQEVPFDNTGNNNNSEGRQIDLKSGQWFGATVQSSGENGVVVACAPRYVWFSQTLNRRDPVGTCYVARNSFREYSEYSPCRTRNWGHHRQGSCQAGLGASIAKDGYRLYVGAVGSWYWQGQIYSINPTVQLPYTPRRGYAYGAGQLFSQSLNNRPAVVNTKEGSALDDDSYLGYSVAVGDFGDGSGAAVGMPRGAGLFGKVILYTWNLTNYYNLTGKQLGSYFGYALCVSDMDGDGRDDLVIGAPLYTDLSNNKDIYETGRIYVYYQGSNDQRRFQEFHIRDGKNSRSRFGLSLSMLGDINKDNYGDIVVGAPYDGPEGRGAIYIYHGSDKGIMEKPSQVIQAEVIFSTLSTFGFSVAGGMDLDENEYPDLVVGAYEADTAVYLRARPVVKLDATITFHNESRQLSLDKKACKLPDHTDVVCTDLNACLEFSGVGVDHKLDFEVQFVLDTKKPKSPRMYFLSEIDRNIMNYTLRLDKDSLFCKSFTVYIKDSIRDKLTPLEAEMRYSLRTGSGASLSGRRRVTRSLVPILDQSKDSVCRDSISIQKNCGSDNICIPDLHLNVTSSVKRYLLGSEDRLELDVIVENKGEASFETTFTMSMPQGINYINIERMDNAEREYLVQCSAPSKINNNTLRCDLGNPLPQHRIVHFKVLLKPSLTEQVKPRYEFKMNVNSTNPENELSINDNSFKLTVPIWVDAELKIHGDSKPKDLHYNMTLYEAANGTYETEVGPQLVHIYTITNKGPSTIKEAEAYFVWPSFTFADENILYLLEMPETEGPVSCELVGDAKANALNLKLNRKKKLEFGDSSSSSQNSTSSNSTTSFSSSTSTFSSSSSSISSGTKTQQGSQAQESPDSRLTTLTDEERLRYDKERKFGFEAKEDFSITGGNRSSGHYEEHHSLENSYGTGTHQAGGGTVQGGELRVENERGRRIDGDGRRIVEYGAETTAGGAQVGAAGESRTHFSHNYSTTYSGNSEAPHRYSNYSYSNWTSGGNASGLGPAAYGRGMHEVTSSRHSSSRSGGYSGEEGSSTRLDNLDSAGNTGGVFRHHSSNWSEGSRNVEKVYQGAGHGGAAPHFTFSTETSDISDNIGGSYQGSHLSNAGRTGSTQGADNRTRLRDYQIWSTQDNKHGFDNVGTNQFDSELEESARGSEGLRHYIFTPKISGGPGSVENNRHESSSIGLDNTRGHIGIKTDNVGAKQQWYSGSESSQYGEVGGGEAGRRQHGSSHSSSYNWRTSDGDVTHHPGSNHDADVWRRGQNTYGAPRDNTDESQHYNSNYGHDYNADRRGTGAFGTGSNSDKAQHYSSSSSVYGDTTGQYGSGGEHRGGSQHYSSQYESGSSWRSSDKTVGENKLEGNEDESSGQLKLYRKYRHHSSGEDNDQKRQSRQRRNVDDAELERATHCNTTRCSKIRCVLGQLSKGQEVRVALKFLVWAKTLMSLGYNRPANVSSLVATRLTRLPYVDSPDQVSLRTEELITEVVPTDAPLKPEIVPLWIVVLSACAGAIILLLLIFLLWKCGFFKRNRPSSAPEKEPLNRNGHYEPGDEAL